MFKMKLVHLFYTIIIVFASCSAKKEAPVPQAVPFQLKSIKINTIDFSNKLYDVEVKPTITIFFTAKIDKTSIDQALIIRDKTGNAIDFTSTTNDVDSSLTVMPKNTLRYLYQYNFSIATTLKSSAGANLNTAFEQSFFTKIDSSRKFPPISDDQLMDKVQQQTLKYFWDYGHPISGLSRERNSSPEVVTSGGSGFGIMSLIVGASRNFIPKDQVLTRMTTIASFLKNTAQTFHGAFPHWMNGATGKVIPFSAKDDGADLVETSYLAAGLICAREYFSANTSVENQLRSDINTILDRIEWSWFRRGNQNVLYWHWSPNYDWQMNMPIRGWNECLITYVMAAASKNFAITAEVYSSGWAKGTEFINGNNYFGYSLPLGPASGGPLFFEHYSFLGINPFGLKDAFANYELQTKNHTLINYAYCLTQKNYPSAYSDSLWGLTACDVPNGYNANSTTNDKSVIAPTAALSSMPYTPEKSMAALKFYYYVLGDKLFKEYGFIDAFSLKENWFADSFLAIDQGPIIVMLENYRSGLMWKLFMQAPEVRQSLKTLGFTSPAMQ